MNVRAALALAAIFLAAAGASIAQQYPPSTPSPRTTSLPLLHGFARKRELDERFRLGLDAERRGDWQAAAPEFERVIALHPDEPVLSTAHYDLGIAYYHLQRLDESSREFQAAIDGDPGFLAAMANLISVDLARGDFASARNVADRFVAAAPSSARALYSRGIVALQSSDWRTARDDFAQLLRNDPSYALAHYNLGVALARSGDYASAEHEFTLSLDLAPAYARARFALGTILLRQGERSKARDAFDRVVKDANGDPALQNLALAMRDSIRIP